MSSFKEICLNVVLPLLNLSMPRRTLRHLSPLSQAPKKYNATIKGTVSVKSSDPQCKGNA